MATKLDHFEFTGPRSGGRTAKYPWDEWLDGGVWLLGCGTDYMVPTASFASLAYGTAEVRGLKLRAHCSDGGIIIQAYEK